ncbi:ATP-binding cassette domain-containing protein [Marinitoga aeolica]|uniref:ATP-binding cassette domain-containing protein n=1 Tax=Marinitoga aeolica TaxID=2809031 RepID=A0ABY8PSL3_9BACT|nr:ATP-binding cassette domain-containing protein [Marinitoga aeolica]WGS65626.1 ATP-binding cassette domain-containing protein [Marinitoga aeolica]
MKKNTAIGLILILLVWWIIAVLNNNQLLIPFPQKVFLEMVKLFKDLNFYGDLLNTFLKIIVGFFISVFIGIPIGIISGLSKSFFEIFRPFLMLIQSSPVVSYIAIAMLWFGIGFYTPVFVAFMVIFPVVVLNISEGIRSTDKKLLEMAKVFNLDKKNILLKIYFPSLIPFLKSTLNMISGSLWKSVVVGEFLAGDRGLGVSLSFSKIALNTDRVFAYTILLAILGMISEKMLKGISSKNLRREKEIKNKIIKSSKKVNRISEDIIIKSLNKKFDDNVILSGFDIAFKSGKINVLLGESGIGKTTILNILSGIVGKDNGEIYINGKIGYIFQDDRLVPWLNVYENIKLVNEDINLNEIIKYLNLLNLEKDILTKYPDELSGGMKKRVNILRAIAYNPDIILMDEAFASLDISNKYKIIKEFINIQKKEKFTVIMVTHDPFEVSNLGENVFLLEGKPLKIKKKFKFKNVFERNIEYNHTILYEINKILLD